MMYADASPGTALAGRPYQAPARPVLSATAAALVIRSKPLLHRHRDRLQRAIGRYLVRTAREPAASASRQCDIGRTLMGWLLEAAPALSEPERTAWTIRWPDLETDDLSRFGDGLAAVITDVLGDQASPPLLWAWGDTFWAALGAVRPRRLALAARRGA